MTLGRRAEAGSVQDETWRFDEDLAGRRRDAPADGQRDAVRDGDIAAAGIAEAGDGGELIVTLGDGDAADGAAANAAGGLDGAAGLADGSLRVEHQRPGINGAGGLDDGALRVDGQRSADHHVGGDRHQAAIGRIAAAQHEVSGRQGDRAHDVERLRAVEGERAPAIDGEGAKIDQVVADEAGIAAGLPGQCRRGDGGTGGLRYRRRGINGHDTARCRHVATEDDVGTPDGDVGIEGRASRTERHGAAGGKGERSEPGMGTGEAVAGHVVRSGGFQCQPCRVDPAEFIVRDGERPGGRRAEAEIEAGESGNRHRVGAGVEGRPRGERQASRGQLERAVGMEREPAIGIADGIGVECHRCALGDGAGQCRRQSAGQLDSVGRRREPGPAGQADRRRRARPVRHQRALQREHAGTRQCQRAGSGVDDAAGATCHCEISRVSDGDAAGPRIREAAERCDLVCVWRGWHRRPSCRRACGR